MGNRALPRPWPVPNFWLSGVCLSPREPTGSAKRSRLAGVPLDQVSKPWCAHAPTAHRCGCFLPSHPNPLATLSFATSLSSRPITRGSTESGAAVTAGEPNSVDPPSHVCRSFSKAHAIAGDPDVALFEIRPVRAVPATCPRELPLPHAHPHHPVKNAALLVHTAPAPPGKLARRRAPRPALISLPSASPERLSASLLPRLGVISRLGALGYRFTAMAINSKCPPASSEPAPMNSLAG